MKQEDFEDIQTSDVVAAIEETKRADPDTSNKSLDVKDVELEAVQAMSIISLEQILKEDGETKYQINKEAPCEGSVSNGECMIFESFNLKLANNLLRSWEGALVVVPISVDAS
ncbi:hypothetical protein HAX54_019967 [Datura stramonium]|uniref:Uncharacterized protein n=1 Tax=Datura stramonium TaxID=4076 RepID=A0ABS8US59_DATST|nr:hypothetical protein [Datura stramonium]